MATQRIRRESYGSKLGNSIKGVFFGIIAILIAFVLLWWNEGKAVRVAKSLEEGASNCVSVSADEVNDQNEGNLVHFSGLATTEDVLSDAEFGFEETAIKFRRMVEMYQYKEHVETEEREKVGGSSEYIDTYTYEEVWSSDIINSDNFEESWRKNPKSFNYKGQYWTASDVYIADYDLSDAVVNSISGWQSYPVTSENYTPKNEESVVSGMIYFGNDFQYPAIGDERIYYEIIYPKEISVVAKQYGKSVVSYTASNGESILLVEDGVVTAEQMFENAQKENTIRTWIFRFVGFILMFIGFAAVLKPLSVAGSVLPFLGNLLGAGVMLISGVVSFALSTITIAVSWIFYRPVLGILLLVVGIGVFVLAKKYLGKKNDHVEQQTETT